MKTNFQLEQNYTFADYFKLNYEPEDILGYFGYELQLQNLALPRYTGELDRLQSLQQRIEESLPYISLTSEMARREFLIAPILIDLSHYTQAKLRVAYMINASSQLKGELDYYIQSQNNLLVIEAKNADLQKGFTQLAVELIALDRLLEMTPDTLQLTGAVSTGNIWQFGILDRSKKQITQDLVLYRVPTDMEELLRILVGIVKSGV
jgi:hypothetical protein